MGLAEAIILAVLAASTPLLLAAAGELVAERAGVLNLGVEGMMIMGAACGFAGAYLTGSTFIGALCGIAAGAALSLVFALLTLGLARADWDLLARGLHDRLHQQQRAHLFPRSFELAMRARELGALGATISGAGPSVLVWCFYEQTGAVAEALAPEIDGWARLLRASFEPQGAYVGEL